MAFVVTLLECFHRLEVVSIRSVCVRRVFVRACPEFCGAHNWMQTKYLWWSRSLVSLSLSLILSICYPSVCLSTCLLTFYLTFFLFVSLYQSFYQLSLNLWDTLIISISFKYYYFSLSISISIDPFYPLSILCYLLLLSIPYLFINLLLLAILYLFLDLWLLSIYLGTNI